MGLPRPLNELIEIARRDDWHKILVGSDLRLILNEVVRLQEIDRERLANKARVWKKRLGQLDMMAAEMVTTPGAEALLARVRAVNLAIVELDGALNLAISGKVIEESIVSVEEIGEAVQRTNTLDCRSRAEWITVNTNSEVYRVPTGKVDQTEQLGAVTWNADRWDWRRHHSDVHDWNCTSGGTVDTLLQAKNKVLEGWDAVKEDESASCRSRAKWTASGVPGRELYHVPTGKGIAVEWLGVVAPNENGYWAWIRHNSEVHDWDKCGGTANSKKDAKAKVLEGWGPVEEINTMRCRSEAKWIDGTNAEKTTYQVPTGRKAQIEYLGTVEANGASWEWWRFESYIHDWNAPADGIEDTLEQAKGKVLEGWDE